MTRKDFQLIADVFNNSQQRFPHSSNEHMILEGVAVDMARSLRTTNAAFDKDRFMAACGF